MTPGLLPRAAAPARAQRGYSFVELVLVVAVAAVLAMLAIPTGLMVHRRLREEELRRGLSQVRAAIDRYHRDWEKGCIESDDEKGWPRDIDELHDGVVFSDEDACHPERTGGINRGTNPLGGNVAHGLTATTSRKQGEKEKEPEKRVYLPHVPRDPFNEAGDAWDVSGWKARSYDDEIDSTSWKGDAIYDVYSSSELKALDGTPHAEW